MSRTNSPTTSSPEIIELTIDSLSYNGGRGVGRHEGLVVFVPGTAPQDRVKVQITSKKSRLWEGELKEVIEPSPVRRKPPCPVAGVCGGCSWQHVEYATQVEEKKKILAWTLRPLNQFGAFEFLPFLEAKEEFNYRNRIQVQVKGTQFGFFGKRSHDLVTVNHCWIAEEAINAKLKTLNNELGAQPTRRIEIAVDQSGEVLLMRDQRDPEAALFAQVNTAQNTVLKKAMVDLIRINPDWILDLYAGAGNLASSLGEKFPAVKVDAFELSQTAVDRGRKILPQVTWHAGDVEKTLARVRATAGEGLIVLDPPRVGASAAVLEAARRLKPKQILYISCNPTTFARDCERLLVGGEFRLEKVQGLDMFPQTEHVELLASLCAAT